MVRQSNNLQRGLKVDVPHRSVGAMVASRVKEHPEELALVCGARKLSYSEVWRLSGQIASGLLRHDLRPGCYVGVQLPRSEWSVIALLGILRAGLVYLPTSASQPQQRRELIWDQGRPELIIGDALHTPCDTTEIERLLGPEVDVGAPVAADDSYVIFTSGSTGEPKGAINTTAALINRLAWQCASLGNGECTRVLHKTSPTFDVSIWEMLWPLTAGGTVCVARDGVQRDPQALSAIIRFLEITTVHFTPSALSSFLEATRGVRHASVRAVISVGEELSPELVLPTMNAFPNGVLYNWYGPAETAIEVSAWTCSKLDVRRKTVPIGHPIWNTEIRLVAPSGHAVRRGEVGEIVVCGRPVGNGYIGRPELTAQRFVGAKHSRCRMYRTGDLGVIGEDGALEFRGRIDRQVKIRGERVELEEVERVLGRHPGVARCAALLRQVAGHPQLCAIVEPRPSARPASSELREFAKLSLPDAALPNSVVFVDSLPQSMNGKLDTTRLDALVAARDASPTGYALKATDRVAQLKAIWESVTGTRTSGGDFRAEGGDSLKAVELICLIRDTLGVEVPFPLVLTSPTLDQLAQAIENGGVSHGQRVTSSLIDRAVANDYFDWEPHPRAPRFSGLASWFSHPGVRANASPTTERPTRDGLTWRLRNRRRGILLLGLDTQADPSATARALIEHNRMLRAGVRIVANRATFTLRSAEVCAQVPVFKLNGLSESCAKSTRTKLDEELVAAVGAARASGDLLFHCAVSVWRDHWRLHAAADRSISDAWIETIFAAAFEDSSTIQPDDDDAVYDFGDRSGNSDWLAVQPWVKSYQLALRAFQGGSEREMAAFIGDCPMTNENPLALALSICEQAFGRTSSIQLPLAVTTNLRPFSGAHRRIGDFIDQFPVVLRPGACLSELAAWARHQMRDVYGVRRMHLRGTASHHKDLAFLSSRSCIKVNVLPWRCESIQVAMRRLESEALQCWSPAVLMVPMGAAGSAWACVGARSAAMLDAAEHLGLSIRQQFTFAIP